MRRPFRRRSGARFLAQQVARARLLHHGLLLQGEPAEADLHLLRAGADAGERLAAREGDGVEARDGNGPREVAMWHHGENV